jgi:DNA-directed RNA polymerase specialized sigma24 family protein
MPTKKRPKIIPGEIEEWELKRIAEFARSVERSEPEELQAELARQLLVLKSRQPRVSDWRSYFGCFLRNKFINWRRHRRRRETRQVPLDAWSEDEGFKESTHLARADETNAEDLATFVADFRKRLTPPLRRLWDLLAQQKKFTQIAAARQLRKHRNTIRFWLKQIHQGLLAHAKSVGQQLPEALTLGWPARRVRGQRPRSYRAAFVPVSVRLLQTLAQLRLSGTQWRILFKVLLDTAKHKRTEVPFTWYRMARDLSIDRSGLGRAGKDLLRRGLIAVHDGKIGLDRTLRQSRVVKWRPDNPRR